MYKLYAYIFCRNIFKKFHEVMFQLSVRGLGIMNYSGAYLTGEEYWLKRYLHGKRNPVVVDVGANIGKYSMAVMKANYTSNIYAFEPHPRTYQKLINNIGDANFHAYNIAIGNERSKIKLYDYDKKDGSEHASLYEDVIKKLRKSEAASYDVDIETLHLFFQENKINEVDLLKVDVEGGELNVLKGAEDYIKEGRIKAIHFEFNDANIVSKASFKDFWELLHKYDIYRILVGGTLMKLDSYNPLLCEIYGFQNIVALKKDCEKKC